jgi:hypothetical protein
VEITFESCRARHFGTKLGTAKPPFCAGRGDESAQEHAFRPHDANFLCIHLDTLGQRSEVVADPLNS